MADTVRERIAAALRLYYYDALKQETRDIIDLSEERADAILDLLAKENKAMDAAAGELMRGYDIEEMWLGSEKIVQAIRKACVDAAKAER